MTTKTIHVQSCAGCKNYDLNDDYFTDSSKVKYLCNGNPLPRPVRLWIERYGCASWQMKD